MDDAITRAIALAEQIRADKAKKGLLAFTAYTKKDFVISWHHRAIAIAVNAMFAGDTPRTLLTRLGHSADEIEYMMSYRHPVTKLYGGCTSPDMLDKPFDALQVHVHPRAGKTELISRRLPAMLLGMRPTGRIIATSYGADLAAIANRDVQRIIDNEVYQKVFPDTTLNNSNVRTAAQGSWLRNSDMFEVVGHGGSYKSSGVGGGITGLGCSLAALIDDPFKSRKQANSPLERATVMGFYNSTLFTRIEQGCKQIIINTRWHEDDLSGQTLSKAMRNPTSTQWFSLVFPAILDCEPGPGDFRAQGEAMWPERFSRKRLDVIQATIGNYEFEALYQQRPGPGDGGIIKAAWWQFYDHVPTDLAGVVISCDLTFSDRGDFAVFQVWGYRGAMRYLIEERRERMSFTQQHEAAIALSERYPQATAFLVENSANGAALINVLTERIPAMIPIRPEGSKSLRLDAVSPQIMAGNVVLPAPTLAPWIEDWIEEFKNFPNGAHDDRVDACSQALAYLRTQGQAFEPIVFPDLEKKSDWDFDEDYVGDY